MHKTFYASGFLYHPPTQQILLHQPKSDLDKFSIFSSKGLKKETPEEAFMRTIDKMLGINIKLKNIHKVYDYFNEEIDANYHLFLAEFNKLNLNFNLSNTYSVGWLPLAQINKLNLEDQTRQDIIVGQRVINYLHREGKAFI